MIIPNRAGTYAAYTIYIHCHVYSLTQYILLDIYCHVYYIYCTSKYKNKSINLSWTLSHKNVDFSNPQQRKWGRVTDMEKLGKYRIDLLL